MESQEKKGHKPIGLSLTDERILKKILTLFISVSAILLAQGIYSIISINHVDGSIGTLYKTMERVNRIEIEITEPINNVRKLSMTQVMAPNAKIAEEVKKEIDASIVSIDKTLEKWKNVVAEVGHSKELGTIITNWEVYKKHQKTTSGFVQEQIREAAFLNNTAEEKKAHDDLMESIKGLGAAQLKIRDGVYKEAKDAANFSFWLSLTTTLVEIAVLKLITFIIVRMINNYIKSMRANEKDLKERREFFANIIKSIPGVFYRVDYNRKGEAKLSYISEQVNGLLGVSDGQILQSNFELYNSKISIKDRENAISSRNISNGNGEGFTCDYEITDSQGHVKCVSEVGRQLSFSVNLSNDNDKNSTTQSADENVRSVIGFIFDVTERKNLERQNEKQKRKIDNILSNTPIGIMTIDQAGNVTQCSAEVLSIMENKDILSRSIGDTIFNGSSLSAEQRSMLASAIEASVNEHVFNFDANRSCFPEEFSLQLDNKKKYVEASWSYIEQDETVDEIILCMKDVTVLKKLKEEEQEKKQKLNRLEAVINLDTRLAREHLHGIDKLISECKMLSQKGELSPDERLHLMRDLHTLKGNARSLEFVELSEKVHSFESELIASESLPQNASQSISELENAFKQYHDLALEIGKIQIEGLSELHISHENFTAIEALAVQITSPTLRNHFVTLLNQIKGLSLDTILSSTVASIPSLCERLNKREVKVNFGHNDATFKKEKTQFFTDIFNHLIRNSLSHGIPSRQEQWSEKSGFINVDIKADAPSNSIEITYSDNGKGLNLKKIKETAVIKNLISAEEADLYKIAAMIFQPRFSTSDEVTDISGRGVGMDVVSNMVKNQNGELRLVLESTVNEFGNHSFMLIFKLPFHNFCYSSEVQMQAVA